ncbi:MAG: hypothetical protein AB7O62_24205 [Pirellulales bacterium]
MNQLRRGVTFKSDTNSMGTNTLAGKSAMGDAPRVEAKADSLEGTNLGGGNTGGFVAVCECFDDTGRGGGIFWGVPEICGKSERINGDECDIL